MTWVLAYDRQVTKHMWEIHLQAKELQHLTGYTVFVKSEYVAKRFSCRGQLVGV